MAHKSLALQKKVTLLVQQLQFRQKVGQLKGQLSPTKQSGETPK